MYSDEYASFLVRCWRDPLANNQPTSEQTRCKEQDCWRGEIEHIQSGSRWRFASLTALLNFLQQAGARPGTTSQLAGAEPATQDDVSRE